MIGYLIDGETETDNFGGTHLFMQIDAISFPKRRAYFFSFIWTFFILILFILLRKVVRSYENLFIILYLTMGVLAFVVFPPFSEPDSGNHYRRAYAVSEGILNPGEDENHKVGGEFSWPSTWYTGDGADISWYEAKNGMEFRSDDPATKQYLTYTNIARYSPVCHLIPALAMKATRIFTRRIIVLEYTAKILCYFVTGIVFYLAVCIAPFGKAYILLAILHPYVMRLFTSISPDSLTIAMIYLLSALVLRLRYDKNLPVRRRDLIAIYLLSFLIGQFKIVYLSFVLILFAIPVNKFKSKRNYYLHASAIGTVTLLPAFLWLTVSTQPMATGKGSNASIVLQPLRYLFILLNTVRIRGYGYVLEFFGDTLTFKDETHYFGVILFLILAVSYVSKKKLLLEQNDSEIAMKFKKDLHFKLLMFLAIEVTTVLIFTSQFLTWTDPGSVNINGVQSRYFFPFIYPGLVLLSGMGNTRAIDGEVLYEDQYRELFLFASVALVFCSYLFLLYQL